MKLPISYKTQLENAKPITDEKDFWLDPDKTSPGGLLLSDRIQFYTKRVNLIFPFDEEFLEPASYTLHAGGEYLNHDQNGKVTTGFLNPGETIVIPPNGLVYMRFLEEVNIPHYMIARFNLRVKQVYRGLLLGTGPQVDPGFRGHLGCPLHNFTNENKTIKYFENLITIDFEKCTPLGESTFFQKSSDEVTLNQLEQMQHNLLPVRGIDNLPCKIYNKQQDRPLKDYLPVGESVQSSVFELQERVKQLQSTVDRYRKWTPYGAILTLVAAIWAIYQFVYTNLETKYSNLENNSFNGYMNLENKFFSSYTSLKDEIGGINKSIGELQAGSASKGAPRSQPTKRGRTDTPALQKTGPN